MLQGTHLVCKPEDRRARKVWLHCECGPTGDCRRLALGAYLSAARLTGQMVGHGEGSSDDPLLMFSAPDLFSSICPPRPSTLQVAAAISILHNSFASCEVDNSGTSRLRGSLVRLLERMR